MKQRELTPFATVFRYEEMPYSTAFDRAASLRLVQRIRSHVEAVVSDIPETGEQPHEG